jgi:hypothetical protein
MIIELNKIIKTIDYESNYAQIIGEGMLTLTNEGKDEVCV